MRVDGEREVVRVGAELDRERASRDQLARVRADDARAEQAPVVLREEQLREALAAPDAERAPARAPREDAPSRPRCLRARASSSVSPTQATSGSV